MDSLIYAPILIFPSLDAYLIIYVDLSKKTCPVVITVPFVAVLGQKTTVTQSTSCCFVVTLDTSQSCHLSPPSAFNLSPHPAVYSSMASLMSAPCSPFLETQHSSQCQHKLNPTCFPGFYLICINYFFRKSTGLKSHPISEILHYKLSIQTMSNQTPCTRVP